jgi:hypothetical protein
MKALSKMNFYKKYLFICVVVVSQLKGQSQTRYIFLNTMPGKTFMVARPSTYNRKFFEDVIQKVNAPVNSKMRLGISAIFDFLSTDIDSVEKSLDRFMQISMETKIPILINLDGINWMNGRPDLWNWWDPNRKGYNPSNKKNVEWTGWGEQTAIKISWRNWGTQFRVFPAPNLSSPAIIEAQISALERLVPRIVKWYNSLPPQEKYLLGGVKLGHEVSIGVNAYYYRNGNRYIEQMPRNNSLDPLDSYNSEAGINGGVAQIGFASVKTAGIKDKGIITAADLEQVVHLFLDTLCKTTFRLGLPKNIIYTHQGGTFAPWEKHLSFSAGVNDFSNPGWSFYSTDPNNAGDLGKVLDKRTTPGWAAVEWWWGGADKNEWIHNLKTTLQYKDCRFLAIYNWETLLGTSPDGIEAVKDVIANWK